jgi:GTP cyclohydrolase I
MKEKFIPKLLEPLNVNNPLFKKLESIHRIRCEILGIDLTDPENERTPFRCAKADWEQFQDLPLNFTIFDNRGYDEMVVKPNIPFASFCQHHLLPYFGSCSIGYIPHESVCGLSKLTRIVKSKSKGASSQEWLTESIIDFLAGKLNPVGIIVIMKARHTCETCRGAFNDHEDSHFITSAVRGVFKDDVNAKSEFLSLLRL